MTDAPATANYDPMRPIMYTNADVFLICFSIIDPDTYKSINRKWIPEIQLHRPNIPYILVGTNCEMRDDAKTIAKLETKCQQPIQYQEVV